MLAAGRAFHRGRTADRLAGRRGVKRVTLELGGHTPVLVSTTPTWTRWRSWPSARSSATPVRSASPHPVPAPAHALDREEIFIALSGTMSVTMGDETITVTAGDALIVPAHQQFAMSTPSDESFEAIVVLPVGGQGLIPGQPPSSPLGPA
jgi:mannose-6-phosphate isomerase-like protein (cupin superfamily)